MKQQRLVSIKLTHDLIAAVERAAHAGDVSPAEVIRGALNAAFLRMGRGEEMADLAAVRAALKQAQGWLDLQSMLRAIGYVLRPEDDALVLCTWPIETRILPLSVLGTDLPTLSLRYRAPFPGLLPTACAKVAKPVVGKVPACPEGTGITDAIPDPIPDAIPVFRTLRARSAAA